MSSYYEKFPDGKVVCIDEEIPFEIPKGWEWCRLGEIVSISSGDGLTSSQMILGDIPVYGGNGITGYHNKANVFEHTIVIGRVGFYCGSVHETAANAWVTDNAFVTKYPTQHIDKHYLIYTLRHMDLGKQHNATAQPVVSGKKIYPLLFPLPPLSEQRRIVEKIEELMPLVKEFDNAQTELDTINVKLTDTLKKSILQEAIRGKLVPQIASEGDASDLLQQIEMEKQRFIKEGKLKKKDLVSSTIFRGDDNKYYEQIGNQVIDISDEIPFEIPDNWQWARIKTLYKTTSGGTPEKGHPEYYNGSIPWVKVGDLDVMYLSRAEEGITELGLNNSSAKIFPKDTILIAMYCNDAIGKTSILCSPMCTNQAICGLFPNTLLHKEYIYHIIQASRERLQEQAVGGAQKNINQKIVNELLIPIPPYKEQERIAARIDELQALLN